MATVIRMHQTGGPEVLQVEQQDVGRPGPGQVRLRHGAVGLNYADTYFRNGTYPIALPNGMGVEGSGTVLEVGEGVTHLKAGDRVTYTGFVNTLGAYSDERLVAADPLILLPDAISFETAAAMTMRGLTSAYLMRRIYDWKGGDTVLLHAAAGGVGLIVAQWAQLLGLTVIGTVSTEEKAAMARAHGVTHTINYSHENVAQRVKELTGGRGVDVVVEIGGAGTLAQSIEATRVGGHISLIGVLAGWSGDVPTAAVMWKNIAVKGITVGSIEDQEAMVAAIEANGIVPVIDRTFPLEEIAAAFEHQIAQKHFGKICLAF